MARGCQEDRGDDGANILTATAGARPNALPPGRDYADACGKTFDLDIQIIELSRAQPEPLIQTPVQYLLGLWGLVPSIRQFARRAALPDQPRSINPLIMQRRKVTMNRYSFTQTRLFCLVLAVGVSATARAGTWRGTAPFCAGQCLPGEREVQRSDRGDGAVCWTGSKVLCEGRIPTPTCLPVQTNVACKGVVLTCDNGFYTQTTNQPDWHSCSTYACGACLGWWSDWKEPVSGTARGLSPLSVPSLPRNSTLPNLPYGPDTCKSGYVWRDAIPNDHVCVTPASREQAVLDNSLRASRISPADHTYGPETCIPGYVWREVVPSDRVCVTPQVRDQTRVENSQFETNRARGTLW